MVTADELVGAMTLARRRHDGQVGDGMGICMNCGEPIPADLTDCDECAVDRPPPQREPELCDDERERRRGEQGKLI